MRVQVALLCILARYNVVAFTPFDGIMENAVRGSFNPGSLKAAVNPDDVRLFLVSMILR